MKCSAPNCRSYNYRKEAGISFHRIPKDPVLKKMWLMNMGRPGWKPKPRNFICSKHFAPDVLDESVKLKRRLKPGAVPTLFFDVHATEADIQQLAKEELPSYDSDTPGIEHDDNLAFNDEEATLRDAEDATEICAEADWITEVLEPSELSDGVPQAVCRDCGIDVGGSQWWCVSLGYQACAECAIHDATGYWLRAPEGRPQGEVSALLQALRRELGFHTVKEEPADVLEEPAVPAEPEIIVKKEPKEEPDDDPLASELETDPLLFSAGEQTGSEQVVPARAARKRKGRGQAKPRHTPMDTLRPSALSFSPSQRVKPSTCSLETKRSTEPGPLIHKPLTLPIISKASIKYRVVKLSNQSLDRKPSNDCTVLENTTGSFFIKPSTDSFDPKPFSRTQILDPHSLSQDCSTSSPATTAVASWKAPETKIRKRPRLTE